MLLRFSGGITESDHRRSKSHTSAQHPESWTTVYVQLPVQHTEQTRKRSWDTHITTHWCNTLRRGYGTRAHFSFRNVYLVTTQNIQNMKEGPLLNQNETGAIGNPAGLPSITLHYTNTACYVFCSFAGVIQ